MPRPCGFVPEVGTIFGEAAIASLKVVPISGTAPCGVQGCWGMGSEASGVLGSGRGQPVLCLMLNDRIGESGGRVGIIKWGVHVGVSLNNHPWLATIVGGLCSGCNLVVTKSRKKQWSISHTAISFFFWKYMMQALTFYYSIFVDHALMKKIIEKVLMNANGTNLEV